MICCVFTHNDLLYTSVVPIRGHGFFFEGGIYFFGSRGGITFFGSRVRFYLIRKFFQGGDNFFRLEGQIFLKSAKKAIFWEKWAFFGSKLLIIQKRRLFTKVIICF